MDFDKTGLHALWLRAHNKQIEIEDLSPEFFEDFLTFTDKDSYLLWVQEWKHEYRSMAEHIRSHRNDMKNMQREGNVAASAMQADLVVHRRIASALIAIRHISKVHSWALRNRSRLRAAV